MDTHTPVWSVRLRGAAGAVLLLAAIAATTPGPAPVAAMRQSSRPNYVFETLFEVRPDAVPAFDRYWAALKESAHDGVEGPRRFVDGQMHGTGRRVWLPVERLAEYGFDRRNERVLHHALGDEVASIVIQEFNQAQVARQSYLRRYRSDLSVRRDHDARTPAADVAFVTVVPGKEPLFERAWKRVAAAYAKVRPNTVISVAQTMIGGGPQFVVTRPLATAANGPGFRQEEAVEVVLEAFGATAAGEVTAGLLAAGSAWRTETYLNLGLDTHGAVSRP